ncbi:MAG: PP2C family protein-serine/threonine phosphatase [Candidatus Melainabacteria bacterium]|nr:PP2C family protein-serine/threonine phosphatase [Candidatus Melainabacteria bacterium]
MMMMTDYSEITITTPSSTLDYGEEYGLNTIDEGANQETASITATQVWLLDCDSTFPAKRLAQLNQVLSESNMVVARLNKGKATSYQQLESHLNTQNNTWLLASEGALAKLANNSDTLNSLEEKAQLALEQLAKHPTLNGVQCLLFSEEPLSTASLKSYLSAGVYKVFYANLSVEQWAEHLIGIVKLGEKLRSSQAFGKEQSRLNEDLSNRSLMIEKELYKTRQLQQSLLPSIVESKDSPSDDGGLGTSKLHYLSDKFRISGMYIPCDAIGGDLYDLCEFHDGSLGVIITDVSGHGVPAAFVTALLKSSFYRITHHHQTPDQVLFHLNNQLAAVVKTGDYLTAAYLHFLDEGKTVQYGGAGHPYPILYRAKTNTIELLEENGTPLVWVPDMPYNMQFTNLEQGDKILLFTDGVTELTNPQEELYGEDRLAELLPEVISWSPEGGGAILESILMELSDFTQGHPLADDMTMLIIEVL